MRLILLVSIFLIALQAQPIQVTACDLFENPVRWNGVLISVTGDIKPSPGEGGPWLSGLNCKTQIVVKGLKFPNLVQLTDPKSRTRLHDVEFEWDAKSGDLLSRLAYTVDSKTEHIRGTMIGVFETRTPLDTLVINDKRAFKENGFGHMAAAPAQILVKTITGLRVERNVEPKGK